eukprot:TRINITY_DN4625_c0_g1_i1.p1 TRINITY_DN4625_c0_g1~~TRINITY_DN4625_c0_g1_i1.p1  ORF type:complete len:252 (-),score=47.25 TRINITY_DN4625_c0_g1_i1:409-1164(-)
MPPCKRRCTLRETTLATAAAHHAVLAVTSPTVGMPYAVAAQLLLHPTGTVFFRHSSLRLSPSQKRLRAIDYVRSPKIAALIASAPHSNSEPIDPRAEAPTAASRAAQSVSSLASSAAPTAAVATHHAAPIDPRTTFHDLAITFTDGSVLTCPNARLEARYPAPPVLFARYQATINDKIHNLTLLPSGSVTLSAFPSMECRWSLQQLEGRLLIYIHEAATGTEIATLASYGFLLMQLKPAQDVSWILQHNVF